MGWEFKGYEQFDHTGDIGIRVKAAAREELYTRAGLALLDLLGTWGEPQPNIERVIELEETAEVDLFVAWLSELNFLFQTEGLVFFEFEIGFPRRFRLRARARGRKVSAGHNEVDLEIKAVTYHLCRVERSEKGYSAQVIFDV